MNVQEWKPATCNCVVYTHTDGHQYFDIKELEETVVINKRYHGDIPELDGLKGKERITTKKKVVNNLVIVQKISERFDFFGKIEKTTIESNLRMEQHCEHHTQKGQAFVDENHLTNKTICEKYFKNGEDYDSNNPEHKTKLQNQIIESKELRRNSKVVK